MSETSIAIAQPKPFGKLRSFFWPIHAHELVKLVPMFFLFFLISFVYNLLRCMKVTMIVKAPGSGAFVIPFIKVAGVLPGAFLLIYLFTKLNNRFNREQVFYLMICFFLGFFLLFMGVIYPNMEFFELKGLADWLSSFSFVPEGFAGFAIMIRHWAVCIFYVLCELWGTICLTMLFWGFANEVTQINEAKRFYAIFALGANCSGIFSGQLAQFLKVDNAVDFLPFNTGWEQTVFLQLSFVIFLGGIILALFWWLNHKIYKTRVIECSVAAAKVKKPKLSLRECFVYLAKSRYMLYIVMMVIGYNVVYNLADVIWTDRASQHFTDTNSLNAYMNQVTSATGIVAVVFAFFVSGNAIRIFGWTVAALITPFIWLVTSLGFFGCLSVDGTVIGDMLAAFLGNPANLALLFGAAQICLGRAAKYTVFDETKEITFIPLSQENQRKGKAVIDGIASRFGKSGGSVIFLVLLAMCGNLSATIPYVAVLLFIMIGLWILSAISLGKMVNETIDQELIKEVVDGPLEAPALNTPTPTPSKATS